LIDRYNLKFTNGSSPIDFSGLEGKITDIKGETHFLKVKIY